eukprot:gb/GEZN01020545.1/.p1 GENE.gb/GEZN01020545.1/~~gb/GEZN01020545.1/.p1  ORF type:complete len:145 (+),score=0.37 gb/GEZN01020545.1/:196-630(+)
MLIVCAVSAARDMSTIADSLNGQTCGFQRVRQPTQYYHHPESSSMCQEDSPDGRSYLQRQVRVVPNSADAIQRCTISMHMRKARGSTPLSSTFPIKNDVRQADLKTDSDPADQMLAGRRADQAKQNQTIDIQGHTSLQRTSPPR